ncbi:MAG: HPF/RaiA family ribosome-associated protein, partial [Acidimicrobiales bacterium]|nr:HPF/RaiA family ribosome-associated protein [Acidimicrobiales bacterium]
MQVTVSARHTEVPDNLRVMAEEKIGKLSRFVEGLDHAEVHFSEHKNPRIADKEVCEVTIEGHGHHVRCKVQA